MMEGYPKTKYHKRGGGSILVHDPAQEKALGDDWIDNKIPAPAPPTSVSPKGIKRESPKENSHSST
jgi:hypothetical protein